MLYRKFSSILDSWYKQENKRALLIQGARQIGKTTLIRDFGQKYYGKNFVEINFIKNPSAKEIFEGDISVDEIISKITSFLKRPLVPGKTLIFLDEVQECPVIRTAIKFLVEDGRFDYIESGSLLGLNYKEITSYAVGFEDIYTMSPIFQKANKIVYYTPPISSDLFEQSKKRVHRIGQGKTCFYYQMVCDKSIEQKIYSTLAMRRDYTESLFAEGK